MNRQKKYTKKIFLTIDDSPSVDFSEKINFLYENEIPAILFSIGNAMEQQQNAMINAIKKGFVLGNHSYTHPHFSDISIEEAKKEILKTDQIIEELYAQAGVPRPAKLFRFPYGDKGWSKKPNHFYKLLPAWFYQKICWREKETHYQKLQRFLKQNGYVHPEFPKVEYPFYHELGLDAAQDVYWTFDFMEYNAQDLKEVLYLMEQPRFTDTINSRHCTVGSLIDDSSYDIALIHDHKETTPWFRDIIKKCQRMEIRFESIFDQSAESKSVST